jgi:hypothetical protein
MEPVTRRSFIVTGSAGALGVAGAAALGARFAPRGAEDDPEPTAEELAAFEDPAVLAVRDAAAGKVELLVADRSVVFTDKRLVARMMRAGR